jgi:hypothetical protein
MRLGPNAFLSFAIEIVALGIYGWAPFALLEQPLLVEILLAVVALAIFVLLWARFAAPKSPTRLQGVALVLFKFAIYLPALAFLMYRFGWIVGAGGIVLVAINVLAE